MSALYAFLRRVFCCICCFLDAASAGFVERLLLPVLFWSGHVACARARAATLPSTVLQYRHVGVSGICQIPRSPSRDRHPRDVIFKYFPTRCVYDIGTILYNGRSCSHLGLSYGSHRPLSVHGVTSFRALLPLCKSTLQSCNPAAPPPELLCS
ncbi:hypothetical protein VTK73DRAFT_2271 [Phialemonium thermophilum]|uniref:Secreted protein n=1 Tax=Phialemonium thermophilum TaxID=223376 RepID=A0ABR3VSC7_9PEZI